MANQTLSARVISRNRTVAEWAAASTDVLLKGEIGIEIDTRKMKIGDGVKTWAQLSYANARPEDLVGLGYGDMLKATFATLDPANGYVDKSMATKKLETKRKINGVDFDGTADITVTAVAAGGNADTVDGAHVGTTAGTIPVLDSNAKIPMSMLNDAVLGNAQFQGVWDAGQNIPSIPLGSTANRGWYWICSLPGTHTFKDIQTGTTVEQYFDIGDWIISCGVGGFGKVDNTDAVSSVNGQTGAVQLTKADLGLGNVDNTSDASKPVSTAQQTAINAKVTAAGGSIASTVAVFAQAATRANLVSGETAAVIFGKLMKWFADLSAVAFSGSYSDLSNKPTLGTAAAKDVASSGNASTAQVVVGNDTRLSDTRIPADSSVATAKIAAKAVTAEKIANGTITDTQMAAASLNVSKLFIAAGDTLIINGSV